MDHVWNSLKEWERNWEEQIEYEKNKPDYEGKGEYIERLTGELQSIRKALKEIGRWV